MPEYAIYERSSLGYYWLFIKIMVIYVVFKVFYCKTNIQQYNQHLLYKSRSHEISKASNVHLENPSRHKYALQGQKP